LGFSEILRSNNSAGLSFYSIDGSKINSG